MLGGGLRLWFQTMVSEGARPWGRGRSELAKSPELPLGPKLSHYITLLFRINFPGHVITFYIAELVSNCFLGYVISCVVTKHTMWASDYIT